MTEPRRPAQINPDTLPVLLLLLLVLSASASASFTLSFAGLSAVAPWSATPPHLAWLIPVAFEVALLGFIIAAFVKLHRGAATWRVWLLVWAWTLASSTVNALHAWDAGPKGWQGTAGATLAAAWPVITAVTAHTVAGLAFASPSVDTERPSMPVWPIEPGRLQRLIALRQPPAVLTAPVPRPPSAYVKEQRDTIVRLKNEGMKPGDIAEHLDVSRSAVYAQLAAAAKENA
ncbi:DUF2637 domain-containing protein [Oerskovia jenensis]|uniref:Resolvase HTH domain-containing protein n=1 Tax=Oerskovia jenensis TaxID=162169 RepID=A0ABS2LID8_9CELL|nr:DUF2637 domain-containing protein [Oerskovia jenensis]MBM7480155.1 hypothetical protein [Oerskovia jenensis]